MCSVHDTCVACHDCGCSGAPASRKSSYRKVGMKIVPLTLAQANALVASLHRHHKPAQGHRFSIGAEHNGALVGAVIVGRPVARGCDPYRTAEVVRLVTDGTKNACSFLYSAAE